MGIISQAIIMQLGPQPSSLANELLGISNSPVVGAVAALMGPFTTTGKM